MVLRTLELVGVRPDYLVLVENQALEPNPDDLECGPRPGLSGEVDAYLQTYRPQERADFRLVWRNA